MAKKFPKGLFKKAKSKRLARIISIKSPSAFRKSVTTLKKRGLTTREKRALVLARTRATVQLRRKNLSAKERRQFRSIAKTKIPKVGAGRKRRQ